MSQNKKDILVELIIITIIIIVISLIPGNTGLMSSGG